MVDTRTTSRCQNCRALEIALARALTQHKKAEIEEAYTVYVTHLDEHRKESIQRAICRATG